MDAIPLTFTCLTGKAVAVEIRHVAISEQQVEVGSAQRFERFIAVSDHFIRIITAGGLITGEIGGWFLTDYGNLKFVSLVISGSIPIVPKVPACTVTSPSNIPVNISPTAVTDFTSVGSTSSNFTPFSINLSCSGGTRSNTTNMYMTLTDQTNPGNVSNVLSIASASSASGVGIQLRNAANTVISYGPDSRSAGNTNQWLVQSTGNGTVTIPLTARLVQTAPRVNPGSVVAITTYTMSYQ
jgi:type 1 fimbria pilin